MGSHPLNLAVRFGLEVAALISLGMWGWSMGGGWWRVLSALLLPLLAAIAWATFAVPDDPSRSGKAPVATPGALRLLLELTLFVAAAWALFNLGYATWAIVLAVVAIVHYALSYDRILWLLQR